MIAKSPAIILEKGICISEPKCSAFTVPFLAATRDINDVADSPSPIGTVNFNFIICPPF